jgi:hypothetical protein
MTQNFLVGSSESAPGTQLGSNYVHASLFTAVHTETSHEFWVYSGASGNVKCAIYSDSGGSPGTRLVYDDTGQACTGGQWNKLTLSGASIVSGNDYWLCTNSSVLNSTQYTATSGKNVKYTFSTYAGFSWPSSLTLTNEYTTRQVLYKVYDQDYPELITDCEDEDLGEDETGVILDGSGFSGSSVTLEIGNASSYGACTVKSTQTINSNTGTQIDFDVVIGSLDYGTNWIFITVDSVISAGYEINIHQADPVISDVSPSTLAAGDIIIITGSNFGAVKSSSDVELCPNASLTGGVEQTISSWSDTEIQVSIVKGTLQIGTRYCVVRRNQVSDLSEEYDSNFYAITLIKSQVITYKQLCEHGGGRFAHLWHVAGYPWAVTDDSDLIDALSNYGADTTVQAARKRLFGSNSWTGGGAGTVTPAYTVPIFPGLIVDCNVSWRMNESGGIIDGGNWSVKIEDRIIGHEWEHAVDGDEIWGLEGLHRVANLQDSLVNGWGWIGEKLLRNTGGSTPSQIKIDEQSIGGSILYDRVSALTGDEYVKLWINHECIAVDGVDGTAPNYYLDMVDFGNLDSARGLYRSRPQDHFRARLSGLEPVIADVPGSIIGHYCWLYTIPLTDNGNLRLTPDGDPMIVEELGGVISPNISTEDSLTTIPIRDKTAAVEHLISLESSEAVETNLRGFVFTRGNVPSDDLVEIARRWQQPHLTILEFAWDFDETMTDLYAERYGIDEPIIKGDIFGGSEWLYDVTFWKERYIWLCPPNSTVTFESHSDVIDALNNELEACYHGNATRNSSETFLTHKYKVYNYGKSGFGLVTEEIIRWGLFPYLTGPLAWVFNLGVPYNEDDNIYTMFNERKGAITGSFREFAGWWVMENCYPTIPFDPTDTIFISGSYTDTGRRKYWMKGDKVAHIDEDDNYESVPLFYITYPWFDNAPLIEDRNFNIDDQWFPWPYSNYLPPKSEYDGVTKFYLRKETSVDDWSAGEAFSIGLPSDKRRGPCLIGNIDTIKQSDIFDTLKEIIPETSLSLNPQSTSVPCGYSLFYLPLLDGDDDQHKFSKALSAEHDSLSGIFRAILGESISGISIAKEIQLSNCPFFTTTGDFTSSIDWNSLDELPSLSNIYKIPREKVTNNIFDLLKHELLFHAATMVREFDYEDLMWKLRFRHIGAIDASQSIIGGFKLLGDKALPGAPVENHGIGDIYNALKIPDLNILITNYGSSYVGFTERRILEINPSMSKISEYSPILYAIVPYFYREMVAALSSPTVEQQKGTTIIQSLFPVGREILVTDSTARRPFTHSLGLDLQPALVIATSWNYNKCSGTITYRVGGARGQGTISYGYAPACWLRSGNFSKSVGEWSGSPNDHEFTDSFSQPKDVFFFDCFDLSDRNNPVARTDCSCGDYAVWAIEIDTYDWTPLPFTCSVDADTEEITLTGDTTDIDEGKDYIIVFQDYDNLEDCQKYWIMHADDNNTIGTAVVAANRWV